jgi:recombination protein RecA
LGVSREGELLDLGVDLGVVDKSGAWYAFNQERLGQGKENVRAYLLENKDIAARIEAALMERLGVAAPVATAGADEESDQTS